MKKKKPALVVLLASILMLGMNLTTFGESYSEPGFANVFTESGIEDLTVTVPSGATTWAFVYAENNAYAHVSGGSFWISAESAEPSEIEFCYGENPDFQCTTIGWESSIDYREAEGSSGSYDLYAESAGPTYGGLSSFAEALLEW